MARPNRNEVFSPDESCIVHVISRVVRRCFLLGDDPLTGKNYDHRKEWIEILLQHQAKLRYRSTLLQFDPIGARRLSDTERTVKWLRPARPKWMSKKDYRKNSAMVEIRLSDVVGDEVVSRCKGFSVATTSLSRFGV